MKTLLLTIFITILASGCKSKHKSEYEKCMDSGAIELYGEKLAPDFCNCFSASIISSKSPFLAGNRCAKPIVERMLIEVK